MSAKHNCKHPDRNKSHYPERLSKRGLSKAPQMEDVEVLRKRQERREEQTGVPWWTGKAETEERLLEEIFTAA